MESPMIPSKISSLRRNLNSLTQLQQSIEAAEGAGTLPELLKSIDSATLFQLGIKTEAEKLGVLKGVLDSADGIAELMFQTRQAQAQSAQKRIEEIRRISNTQK